MSFRLMGMVIAKRIAFLTAVSIPVIWNNVNESSAWFGFSSSPLVSNSSRVKMNQNLASITVYMNVRCPKSSQVLAVLDYFDLRYEQIIVHEWSGNMPKEADSKTPFIQLNGVCFSDADACIQYLVQCLHENGCIDSLPDEEQLKWIQAVNEKLVPALNSTTFQTIESCLEAHELLVDKTYLSLFYQYYFAGKKYLSQKDTAAEDKLQLFLADWMNAMQGKQFHGGSSPDIADLIVFGSLNAFENLETMRKILRTPSARWYLSLSEKIGEPKIQKKY